MARLFFLLFIFIIFPASAFAGQPEDLDLFASGLKLFVGLSVVIGLMLIFHVLNRKGFKFLESRHAGSIKIIETRPLGGRKSLCLVEVEGRRILLGLGNDRVDVVHSFAPGSFDQELRARSGEES